jgi:hypothetical protein
MKTLKFLFAALALLMCTACTENNAPEEKPALTATKWKLSDIRNLATGEARTLEPFKHSGGIEEECYAFKFENDTVAYGRSCTNGMYVNIKGTNGRYLGIMTKVYEVTDDCIYFADITRLVDECFFKEDQLIFAYTQDDVRYHLQFRQVKDGQEIENPLEDLPWLKAEVDEIALAIQNGTPLSVSIYRCIYGNGETGFLIDGGNIKPFYNYSGDVLCIIGGDAGETCSELNITGKELIWEMSHRNSKI